MPKVQEVTDLGAGADEPQAKQRRYGCKVTTSGYEFYVDSVLRWRTFERPIDAPVRMCFSAKVQDYTVGQIDDSRLQDLRMKVDWARKYAL